MKESVETGCQQRLASWCAAEHYLVRGLKESLILSLQPPFLHVSFMWVKKWLEKVKNEFHWRRATRRALVLLFHCLFSPFSRDQRGALILDRKTHASRLRGMNLRETLQSFFFPALPKETSILSPSTPSRSPRIQEAYVMLCTTPPRRDRAVEGKVQKQCRHQKAHLPADCALSCSQPECDCTPPKHQRMSNPPVQPT